MHKATLQRPGSSTHSDAPLTVTVLRIAVACVLLGCGIVSPSMGQAQTGSGWSQPKILYDGRVRSHMTTLVSDAFGAAHLVWTLADEETYYYSRWDGTNWTTPIDIVATTADVGLGPPALVTAADGSLHLFWAQDNVMHTWALVDDAATSARAWSIPKAILVPGESARDAMDAKQDSSGAFHLVYTAGNDVYYTHSDAKGLTWTEPAVVNRGGGATRPSEARLDIGSDGCIHAVWDEWPLDGDPAESSRVYYARSIDGGRSWSEPWQTGEVANRGPNVLAVGDGTVYVAWQAGILSPNAGRFIQQSSDGGKTWQEPIRFSNRRGQSGYPSMALDSQGTLHMITGDGEYAFWDARSISSPLDLSPVPEQTENARLAILNGNQVLVIIGPFSSPGPYYTKKQLGCPELPTVPLPTHGPVSTTPPPDAIAEGPASTQAPVASATIPNRSTSQADSSASSMASTLVLSAGLSLALVAGVIVVHVRRRSH